MILIFLLIFIFLSIVSSRLLISKRFSCFYIEFKIVISNKLLSILLKLNWKKFFNTVSKTVMINQFYPSLKSISRTELGTGLRWTVDFLGLWIHGCRTVMVALIRKSNGLNRVSFGAKITTTESSKLKTSNILTTAIRNTPQAAGCKYFNYENLRLGL